MDIKKQDEKQEESVEQTFTERDASFCSGFVLTSVLGGVVFAIYTYHDPGQFIFSLIMVIIISIFFMFHIDLHRIKMFKHLGNISNFFAGVVSWFVCAALLVLAITVWYSYRK